MATNAPNYSFSVHLTQRQQRFVISFFGPGNGSPNVTNVDLVVFVGVGVVSDLRSAKAFSFHNRSYVAKLRMHIDDNIIHDRTVTDFQVKS